MGCRQKRIIMKKLNKIRWWVYVVYLSSKWVFRTNLGDIIIYQKEEYVVGNGVDSMSWTIYRLSDRKRIESAPKKECKKKISFKNYIGSFESGYNFYITNWFGIWCREGIEDWMRGCKIW